jgi:DNA-directed RNA polymerase specialized sigma24 family protein
MVHDLLRKVLARVSPREREIFFLYDEGFTFDEIGRRYGISRTRAQQLAGYTRYKILKEMENEKSTVEYLNASIKRVEEENARMRRMLRSI